MSLNSKVVAQAASGVGIRERPLGANDDQGGWITQANAHWGMKGVPWCGTGQSKNLREAGVTDVSHPSTYEIVQRAKREGWITNRPVPGCLIVWPPEGGTHVEMVTEVLSPTTVATIGCNVSDQIMRKVRSLDGATLVVSPELRDGDGARVTYWLEDVAAKPRLLGPWRRKKSMQKALAKLPPRIRETARIVRMSRGRWAILVGPRRLYGGWPTKEQRKEAKALLEKRLGRRLREFSRRPPAPKAGAAEALGKTT